MTYLTRYAFLLLIVFFQSGFVPDKILSDEGEEARARAIIAHLRCFVCDGQALAQSHNALAYDLRQLVRSKIRQGQSDDEIFDFITARYGEEVLLNPPFRLRHLWLWLSPLWALFLLALLWRLIFYAR